MCVCVCVCLCVCLSVCVSVSVLCVFYFFSVTVKRHALQSCAVDVRYRKSPSLLLLLLLLLLSTICSGGDDTRAEWIWGLLRANSSGAAERQLVWGELRNT